MCHAKSCCLAQASLYLQYTLAYVLMASCSEIALMTCTLAIRQDLNQILYSCLYIEMLLVYISSRVDNCLASPQVGLLYSLAAEVFAGRAFHIFQAWNGNVMALDCC